MIGIVGTVPDLSFPLTHGLVHLDEEHLILEGKTIPIHRGTPALLAAAVTASEWMKGQGIYAFLIGDTGKGAGSRCLYQYLEEHLIEFSKIDVLTFHYLQPDVDWHNRVLFSIEGMPKRPLLIADAGFMYAAKMSGQAPMYDLFTPDAGELAFLADEFAPHPFYTRGFILHKDDDMEALIQRAYQHQNASTYLMVKGKQDMVADKSRILDTIDSPSFEAMEAIGGTGDTLTGLLTALCGFGYTPPEAAGLAARTNRWIGYYANPSPETQIAELISNIPRALSRVLNEFHGEAPYRRSSEKAVN